VKPDDIRKMDPEERLRKLAELRLELIKLRMQARVGTLSNTARIRNIRRDIARILTIVREEELAGAREEEEEVVEEEE